MIVAVNKEVLYVIENDDVEFRDLKNEKFKNNGLINFIRIYKFIPDGISIIKKRRSRMDTKPKATKAPAKKVATKKAMVKKAPTKKVVSKPAKTKN